MNILAPREFVKRGEPPICGKPAPVGGERRGNAPGDPEMRPRPAPRPASEKPRMTPIKRRPPPVTRNGSQGPGGDPVARVNPSPWRLPPESGDSGKFLDVFAGYDINKKTFSG